MIILVMDVGSLKYERVFLFGQAVNNSTGSDDSGVFWVGSIAVALVTIMQTNTLYLHKHEYIWVVKIRNKSIYPLAIILTVALPCMPWSV